MAQGQPRLHEILEELSDNCYFQPPEKGRMKYPCLLYTRAGEQVEYADNFRYVGKTRWEITVIDRDPDSPLLRALSGLQLCSFDRHYVADGLNHDVFTLFF